MDNTILDMYLFETNTLLEQLSEILIVAEKQNELSDEYINEIFRIMHTVKGSSAMMEFHSIMNIAHNVEDLFYYIRENGVNQDYTEELFDIMFICTDMLKADVEKVQAQIPLNDNIDGFIQQIKGFLKKIKNEEQTEVTKAEKVETKQQEALLKIRIFFDHECGMENLRAFMLVTSLTQICDNFKFHPSDVETNSESAKYIVDEGFDILLFSQDDVEKVEGIIKQATNIREYTVLDAKPKEQSAKEQQKQIKSKQTGQSKTTGVAVKQNIISVNLQKLDNLMNIAGEIVIAESMVTSVSQFDNLDIENFQKSARQLRKLTNELQDIVMSMRMLPVSGVFQKMNRIVRDMDKKLSKPVELVMIGEKTEVDKTIVDGIGDPIMHLVRNAMDHGIEVDAETRIAQGKPAKGTITLSAKHTGNDVLISVSDDGKGIDTEYILAKARDKNLLTKPEEEYTKREILHLLMLPGFSTKEQVTEFSGRGVGMDVVKKNIEQIGGTVTMSSELHKGSTTTFRIPLTLAVSACMKVMTGGMIYAVPIANIKYSFKVKKEDIILDADNNEIIKSMDKYYPLVRLHQVYNIPTDKTELVDGIMLLVESDDRAFCLFVDEIIGEQQVVVKPLPSYLARFDIKEKGISGCTILGDGRISLILDIYNLGTMN